MPFNIFTGIEDQYVAPGASVADAMVDFGSGSAPSAPQAAVSAGQPPAQTHSNAMQAIIDQMESDSVNSPVKPVAALNPFHDPLVSLGFAMQGKSAEAVAAGAQIDQQNKRRMDAYNAQVQQAENYRQLRQQRLATTLSGMKAQAERQQVLDTQFNEKMELERQRLKGNESSEARIASNQQIQNDFEERRLRAQEAELARRDSFTNFLNSKGNEKFREGYQVASEAITNYRRFSKVEIDGQKVDLALLSPAERKLAVEQALALPYTIIDLMRRDGFVQEAKSLEDEIEAVQGVDKSIEDDLAKQQGFDPSAIDAKATSIGEARQIRAHNESLQNSGVARGLDSMDVQDIDQAFSYLSDQLAQNRISAEQEGRPLDKFEVARENIEIMGGQLRDGADEQGPTYYSTPIGVKQVKGLAVALAEQMVREGGQSALDPKSIEDNVRNRLMMDNAIPAGFLDKLAISRVVRQKLRELNNATLKSARIGGR